MLYSEFLKGTRAPETPDTYDQFQIIGQIYEDCEGMTKEEAYRIWKQTYGRELKRRELRQRERLELLINREDYDSADRPHRAAIYHELSTLFWAAYYNKDVLARTWKGGGDKFWFRYDPINDGILLKRRTVPEMIWAFKTGGNLISASRERSIEEMYNTVKLINRETGKTATKVNAKNKALYGNTQYYEEISDKDKNLSKLAEQKLKSLSKITSTMNMSGLNSDGAMGQFFVGDPIYVEEKNTGIVGGYWVRNVSHTFLADDAIQLDFDLTATEDIPEIQYDNSKTQSSSCKGKTTTALHVRKGAGTNYASKGVWPKGTSLSIKGQSGSWYEVTGKLKGKEVSGYSHKDYIKITSGKVPK